ncbi:MAG: hypothetical protein ACPHRO_00165 [Nannocystaceae bacterium]
MSRMTPSFHRSVLAAVYRVLDDTSTTRPPSGPTTTATTPLEAQPWHPAAPQLEVLERWLPAPDDASRDTLVKVGYEALLRHRRRLDGTLRARTPCYAIYALERLLARIANYGSVSLVEHRLFDAQLDLQMQPASPALFSVLEGAILAALEHVGATEAEVSHEPHETGAHFYVRWE